MTCAAMETQSADPNDPTKNNPYGVSKLKNEIEAIVIIENIKAYRALIKFSFIVFSIFFLKF